MKELTELISILSPGEAEMLHKYFKVSRTGENSKKIRLFNLIRTGKVKTHEEAIKALYKTNNKSNKSAFSHLKKRLMSDILKILLMEDPANFYSENVFKQESYCRKLIIEADLLLGKGASKTAIKLLEKALQIAEKYECIEEYLMAADILRRYVGIRQGIGSFHKYNDKIKIYSNYMIELLKAKELYHLIGIPNLLKRNLTLDFKDFAYNSMIELKNSYEKTRLAKIGYYYLYIAIWYYEIVNNLKEASKHAIELLKLIENHPAIYTRTREAVASLQLAGIFLGLNHYTKTVEYAIKAKQLFKKGGLNELQAMEINFIAWLNSGELDKAESLLQSAYKHRQLNVNKITRDKWRYYEACLQFKRQRYDIALQILSEPTALVHDKTGWLLGHRQLEILCLIELGEDYVVEYRIEGLKKLILRHKEANVNRIKTITKILSALIKHFMDFDLTYQHQFKLINALQEGKDKYSYSPLGFEIIRFDQWFISRMKKKEKAA